MLGIWITVIVCAIALEIATQVQLISVWAAVGGIAALIADIVSVDETIQIVIFFAVTFVMIALTRPLAASIKKKLGQTPTNADINIGKTGHVTKIIDSSAGLFRVNVSGADWAAMTTDNSLPEVGDVVKVEKIEGVKLIVTPE